MAANAFSCCRALAFCSSTLFAANPGGQQPLVAPISQWSSSKTAPPRQGDEMSLPAVAVKQTVKRLHGKGLVYRASCEDGFPANAFNELHSNRSGPLSLC